MVGFLVATFVDDRQWEQTGVISLAVWATFCAVSNALPVPATRNVYLSMSAPVNIGVAALMPPAVTATVVFGASVSQWELSRSTTLLHASFNRAQLALAAATASVIMQRSPGVATPVALVATAVILYYGANWLLVAVAERLVRGTPVRRVVTRLLPSTGTAVLYVALGFVGVALAAVYADVGAWAVALLLTPLLGARQAVRAAQELEQSQCERARMATQLTRERERERVRIASDIHDVVLQRLAALQMRADTTAVAVARSDYDSAARCAAAIRDDTDQVIADLRDAISNLTRSRLPPAQLYGALAHLAHSVEGESRLRIRIDTTGLVDGLNSGAASLLYEICQEAVTNVARHAQARSVEIGVAVSEDSARLTVRDDGVGYRPGTEGLGLQLMRSKLALAGGSLRIDTSRGGTTLVATTPREC